MRLDLHISTTKNCTRNRAQFFIEQELVTINGKIVKKAGQEVKPSDIVEIAEDRRIEFVARSAVKLDRYLASIGIYPVDKPSQEPEVHKPFGNLISGAICLDVGSSTGGFVQVLLGAGAREVTALDVGTNQLHETLRSDARVISIENTDFREYDHAGKVFDVITADVSFISIIKLLPSFVRVASKNTRFILLFKPQFEVGPENLTKNNLPKSQAIIHAAIRKFRQSCRENGFAELDCRESELPGETGNREWVFLLKIERSDTQ